MQRVSKYLHGTLKNTSMGITNVMGPMEQMALANHPVKGLYFVVTGAPQVNIIQFHKMNFYKFKFKLILTKIIYNF